MFSKPTAFVTVTLDQLLGIIQVVNRHRLPALRLLVFLPLLFIFLQVLPQPWAVTMAYQRAGRALAAGNAGAAAGHLAEAARRLPWRPGLWEQAGSYAWQAGNQEEARKYFEQAALRQALSAQGWLAYGNAQQAAGDYQAALDAWERAEAAGISRATTAEERLQVHLSLENYPAALADLRLLVGQHPADARRRYQLGLLLTSQEPEAALAHLTQAGDLDPTLSESAQLLVARIRTASLAGDPAYVYLESGRQLAALNEWVLAAEAFRHALDLRPDYAAAWAYLGEARQHFPEKEENLLAAYQALEQALKVDPDSVVANTFLAMYWQRQGDDQRARSRLEAAARQEPGNPALQAELGRVMARLGDLEEAFQAYRQAVELAERDPVTWQQLVEFCLAYDYQVAETALPSARQAVLLAPDDPAALDTLGQVLFHLGDLDSAARFYTQAIQAGPVYYPAHVHLGLVAVLRGAGRPAQEIWKWVLSQAPGTPAAAQAARLLQNYFP